MVTVLSAAGTSGPFAATDGNASAPLPTAPQAGSDGFVYWNFTAGSYAYASMYIF
jgi:hypothetical protein